MINMEKIYWTTKNGHKILVDDMDIDHLRNTLKMIIRNQAKSVKVQPKNSFELNGDMANFFNQEMEAIISNSISEIF